MKKYQKDVNGGTDDCQRRRQDLVHVRGHETRRRLRTQRPLVDLCKARSAMAPKFSILFFQRIAKDNTGTLLKYIQFQNFIYHFPEREEEEEFIQVIKDIAIRLCCNLFILKKLCFVVTLPHNTICYLSFMSCMASKFNNEIYENLSTFDCVLRPLPGIRPGTHLGLPYFKPHETALLILGFRSARDQNAEGVERKENGTVYCTLSHSTS